MPKSVTCVFENVERYDGRLLIGKDLNFHVDHRVISLLGCLGVDALTELKVSWTTTHGVSQFKSAWAAAVAVSAGFKVELVLDDGVTYDLKMWAAGGMVYISRSNGEAERIDHLLEVIPMK